MNLNQLEALVEVIRTGSVAAAAHNLFLSAPAVTKQVKALERELNIKLFDKVGRNLVPRHEAQVVSRYALEMFRQVEQMRDELAAGDKHLRGGVSIGCGAFVARALLPPIVARCRREHPLVRISVFEYSRIEEVRAHLQLGEFRIMLALDWLGEPGLIFEPLFDDELVLIVPRDHALAAEPDERLKLAELRGHAVIAHAYPRVLARVFEKADLPEELFNREQPVSVNMRNTETVFAFVEQGIGVAFVPQYMVGLLPHCDVVVRRFVETLPLQFGIYRLPNTKYTVAERVVVDLLREHARAGRTD